jgi:hypothetical protein
MAYNARHPSRLWQCLLVLAAASSLTLLPNDAQAQSITRQITLAGTGSVRALPTGSDAIQIPEFDTGLGADEDEDELHPLGNSERFTNQSIARAIGKGTQTASANKAKSNPTLGASFDSINFRQQRLANGGNQFSVEPPDQGLCVGNGYVLSTVNTVMRVQDQAGNPLSGIVDLNSFYGYAAAVGRTSVPTTFGPSITDPSCYYDADTQRWFLVVLTFDRASPTTQTLSGKTHIDIAVSQTASPLGAWNVYRIAVQNDGTDGTPVHRGSDYGHPGTDCPCFGDYPHIGADANGFYVTTNEFRVFSPRFFNAAQIYALPKKALAAGAASVTAVQFDTVNYLLEPDGAQGFTVWPATSPAGNYATDQNGTEYLLSSEAVFNDSGTDNRIRVWAMTNTRSLGTAVPNVRLVHGVATVATYGVPPSSDQKAGNAPLRDCVNDTTVQTPFGLGCWQFLLNPPEPAHNEVLARLDSNDSRMQQVFYANGKLWGALDTAVDVGGEQRAGIAWFVLQPQLGSDFVLANTVLDGQLALAGNNLTYPALAVLPNGRGVMAFTVVGRDHYPSAGYAGIDAKAGAGDVHIAAEGLGPEDGFSNYKAFGNPPHPRWGDYGAAAVDGNSIWLASEYIGQTCTLAEYLTGAIGSCGGTRTSLGNWGTRISRVTP